MIDADVVHLRAGGHGTQVGHVPNSKYAKLLQ